MVGSSANIFKTQRLIYPVFYREVVAALIAITALPSQVLRATHKTLLLRHLQQLEVNTLVMLHSEKQWDIEKYMH